MTTPKKQSRKRRSLEEVLRRRDEHRRVRLRTEIQRSRAGGRVPTWALAAILVVLVAGWIYLVATA